MSQGFEWYYVGDSGQLGPLSEAQILDLAAHAVLKRETLVWKVGMSGWVPAESIPMLAAKLQPAFQPPPVPSAPSPPVVPVSSSAAAINCPRDGQSMRRDNRSGIEIDWCPSCKGVWLDRGELEKLLQRETSERHYDDDDDDDRYRGRKGRGGFLGNVFDIFD